MPIIRFEYDPDKVTAEQITRLATDMVTFTQEVTGMKEVYAWANASQIRIGIDPVDIFIEMSAHLVPDGDPSKLSKPLVAKIKQWKADHNFAEPINLTFTPVAWQLEIGI
ncbi:MAG TPA: hypothetical protein VHQ86_05800 [Candidatus Saccharimonadia bacterium]|nr:hypothetical protein [Candidatus Saccharimonadia bacterium]